MPCESDGSYSGPNIFSNPDSEFNKYLGFTLPGQAGSRNIMSGPAYAATDAGVYKTFKMPWSERQRMQFRLTTRHGVCRALRILNGSRSSQPEGPRCTRGPFFLGKRFGLQLGWVVVMLAKLSVRRLDRARDSRDQGRVMMRNSRDQQEGS